MNLFSRELLIGIVIGVVLYWAFMHFTQNKASGGN
jgi:hypothetical protein